MSGVAAVGVNNDLSACQTAVAHRTADYETTGRIDEVFGVGGKPLFRDYLVISFFNAVIFVAVFCTTLLVLFFMLTYVFAGKGDIFYYFSHHIISRIIYTFVCGLLLYFLNKFLYKNLRDI